MPSILDLGLRNLSSYATPGRPAGNKRPNGMLPSLFHALRTFGPGANPSRPAKHTRVGAGACQAPFRTFPMIRAAVAETPRIPLQQAYTAASESPTPQTCKRPAPRLGRQGRSGGVRWRPLSFRSRLPDSRPGCAAPAAKTSRASWDWPAPTPRNPTRGPKKRPLDGDSEPWVPMKRSLGASNSCWQRQASYTLNLPTSSHSMPTSLASAAITPWASSMPKTRETGSAGRGAQLGRVGLLRH